MKIFFQKCNITSFNREEEERKKDMEVTWNNWMGPWDNLFGLLENHQKEQDDRMLEPGRTRGLSLSTSLL